MPTVSLDGKTVTYTVRRSRRAKRMRLEMGWETGLSLIVPRSYRIDDFSRVLEGKKEWVLDKLSRYADLRPSATRSGTVPEMVPYLGSTMEVLLSDEAGTPSVEIEQGTLVIYLDGSMSAGLILKQWYLDQARKVIGNKLDEHKKRLGVTYQRFTIRGQKTRWASCSVHGSLSFNWKLVMMPEQIIDYIVIHELAHLRVMNHGKRFWELVASYCPEWREHRKWLKEHEAEIAVLLRY